MKLQCSLLGQSARSLPTGNSGSLIAVVNTNRHRRYLICSVPFFFYGPAEPFSLFSATLRLRTVRIVRAKNTNRTDITSFHVQKYIFYYYNYIIYFVCKVHFLLLQLLFQIDESWHTVIELKKYAHNYLRIRTE